MDIKNIGQFIKTLRTEKKLSQKALAEKLYVTRQAVSSWENGNSIPDIDKMELLSKIFEVSIVDLYAGKKVENLNAENEIICKIVENEKDKLKRNIKLFFITILSLLLIFFIYYFINSYNSIKVYTMEGNEEISVDGIFVISKSKIFFNLNVLNKDINNMMLYYTLDEQEITIASSNDNKIIFQDNYGYNEYLDYNSLSEILDNIYLKIDLKNDKFVTLKLLLHEDFSNTEIFFRKKKILKLEKK